METNRIMIISEKETFLVRVLLKKIIDSGIEAVSVPYDVNKINTEWKGTSLITVYMDTESRLPDDVNRFLIDKMVDEDKKMIIIGDRQDISITCDHLPGDIIYTTFARPLDNGMYIKAVTELFNKMESGEYKKSVLIVDDDPTYLGLVRDWLKSTYKVSMANSGLQAIKWLGKNKADLILLDHEMPVTSGPQVLEMLRSDEETKDIPVIFLTGKGDKESVMAVVALKPEGYLLKNISKDELLQKLDEFFTLRK